MNLLRLLSLMFIFSMAACQKENIKDVTENPPIIVPDTILQYSAGTFSIDSSQLKVDTAYCFVQLEYDSSGNFAGNSGYTFLTGLDGWSPLLLLWAPLSNMERKIQVGNYSGIFSQVISSLTIDEINNWILEGEDPNNIPFGGNLPVETYNAMGLIIKVSNLVDSVEVEDWGGNVKRIVDRGTVELSGNMEDMQGNMVPFTGKFVCFFERYEM